MILYIILLFNISVYGSSHITIDNSIDDSNTIIKQFDLYYNNAKNDTTNNSNWLLLNLLLLYDDNNTLYDSTVVNNYLNIDNKDSILPLSFIFAKHLNDIDIFLSLLFHYSKNSTYYDYIIDYLNNSKLSNNQKFIYYNHKEIDNNIKYILCLHTPSFLDYYFLEYFNNETDLVIDYYTNFIELNNADFFSSSHIISVISIVNGLYKINKENKVFELSKTINNFSDLPISSITLKTYKRISFSSYISGYYQYDIDFIRHFILPISYYFGKEEEIKVRLDYGTSIYHIGDIHNALYEFKYVYDNIELLNDVRYKSASYNNLGIAYYNTGYFENYIQLIISALQFATDNNLIELEVFYLNNLHIYLKNINDYNTALYYLDRINTKAQELGDLNRQALVYRSIATYHRDLNNNYEKSISFFKKALQILKESDNHHLLSTILLELSNTYQIINKYDKSQHVLVYLNNIALKRNDERYKMISHIEHALLYYKINDKETASLYIDSLRIYDKNILPYESQALYYLAKSKYYVSNNNIDYTIKIIDDIMSYFILRASNSSDTQAGFIIIEKEYIKLLQFFISLLHNYDSYNKAIHWMDEVKNLSSFSFYNNPALKSSILTEDELVLDYALRNRIELLRGQLRTASDDQRIQINNLLLEAISRQNSLRRKVLQNIDLEPVDLNRIRKNLGRSDAVLYFSLLNNDLYISTITSGSIDMSYINLAHDDIKRIEEIVKSLSSDRVRLTEMEWLKNLIFDRIVLSDRITNLFIIPDGFLYHIPFEIFPISKVTSDYSYGNTTYLIESKAISYANSLKDLEMSFSNKPSRSYDYDFIGFGISNFYNQEAQLQSGKILPPLPLAEIEVDHISAALSESLSKMNFFAKQSNESNFRKKAGNSRILHLATHSEIFENDPLYSLIYMNSDTTSNNQGSYENDGMIYAYELFQMDISSEMVMLNSCESGSGNYIQGSGIVGFSRAFNYAGAKSLIMNLWSVRDKTAYELSLSFYSYLNQGLSKSEAMRRAKIYYINNLNSNPTYWGSFVVYGNSDPIFPTSRTWTTSILVFIIAMVSFIFAWIYIPAIKKNNKRIRNRRNFFIP